jgi:glucose/arabinose dehydrogenase
VTVLTRRRLARAITLGVAASLAAVSLATASGPRPSRVPPADSAASRIARAEVDPTRTPAAFDPSAVKISFSRVTTHTFSQPVLVTHAGDNSGRLFIVEQTGRVRIVTREGSLLSTPFIDLSASISKGSEQGLLGLAFHPGFRTNGKVYVNFTTASGDTAINEYRVPAGANTVDRASGRRLITIDQPYSNHNGGHIAFGPDGYLYVGMGDGGSAGDPGNRAQNLNSLLGKMLRLGVNTTSGYTISPSNPYVGKTGRDEIWSRGLRNPWRWSFDRATGDLWIADVGQGRYEEVNRNRASAGGGKAVNYGWRVMEGRHCYSPSTGCSTAGKQLPLIEYSHAVSGDDNCSVTGGYVYRGPQTLLQGAYLYGDYCSGRVWAIAATSTTGSASQMADLSANITSFGENQAGDVYMTTHGGAVYRIVASSN